MVEVAKRLREIRRILSLSQQKMAHKLGIALRSYQNYEDSKSMPGGNVLKACIDAGLDANWILTGQGSPLMDKSAQASGEFDPNLLTDLITKLEQRITEKGAVIPASKKARIIVDLYVDALSKGESEPNVDMENVYRFVDYAS